MKIWIDADASPKEAKDIVFRATVRLQIETVLVANSDAGRESAGPGPSQPPGQRLNRPAIP